MSVCKICEHPARCEIEQLLFKVDPSKATEEYDKIAKAYDVSLEDLQKHALFHAPFGFDSQEGSLVRQMKLREADLLAAAAMDQLSTMKMVGTRLRKCADESSVEDVNFTRAVTKPVVDLYVGAGECLRKNVQAIASINDLLNGPKDDGLSGLAALAGALDRSRQNYNGMEDDSE